MNSKSEVTTVHTNIRIATLEPLQGQVDESAMKVSAIKAEDLPENKKQILCTFTERCGKT